MEEDFKKNDSHNLFKYMQELKNKLCKHLMVANNGDGNPKTDPGDVLKCWETYFKKHLNTNQDQRKHLTFQITSMDWLDFHSH